MNNHCPHRHVDSQDLQKGAKIESADGDIIEVIKVEAQRTTKLLELKRPGRGLSMQMVWWKIEYKMIPEFGLFGNGIPQFHNSDGL